MRDSEAHRRVIQRAMNDFIKAHPERDGQRVDADEALWKKVPPFDYQFPSLMSSAGALSSATPLLALFFASLFLFIVAHRRLSQESLL